MKKLIIVAMMLPLFAFSQSGIDFVHGLSWKEIQAKAKAENKYIFLDGWTTWCGPCIFMAKNIFPKPEVGEYFNANFINVKMQLDTSKKDDDAVKKLYQDAHDIMTTYNIVVFPTYLFFDPNGKLVHRAVGANPDAEKFIAKAKDALDPTKQYYVLFEQYKAGKKEPEFLRQLATAAQEAYEMKNATMLSNEYLATQKDLFTKENLEFIDKFTTSSKDVGFNTIANNTAKYDKVMGEGSANKKIVGILLREEVFPKIFAKDAPATPAWADISFELNKKYREFAKEVLTTAKVTYFQNKRDWDNFQVAVVDYMKNYGASSTPDQLNNFAWAIFENCKDMTCVKEALEWSKRSFKDKEDPMYLDTYANILYKLGKKDEAIKWQEKAVALAPDSEKADYQQTVDKMKKGEKTWKE